MGRLLLLLFVTGKVSGIALWWWGGDLGVAALLFSAPGMLLFYHIFVPNAQGLGPVQTGFQTDRREVWLTIDDGPDEADTPRILALLARHRAKAIFFLIGERAAQRPELIRAIVDAGHEIGHHTHTHPISTLWCSGPATLRRELDQALAVFAAQGIRPRFFRAPVGIKSPWLDAELRHRGLRQLGWSARSMDTVQSDPIAVAARVLRRLRPGGIILLHEGPRLHPRVREHGLEAVLSALEAAGYACVRPARPVEAINFAAPLTAAIEPTVGARAAEPTPV